MEIKNFVITGDELFVGRRVKLIETLRNRFPNVEVVTTGRYYQTELKGKIEAGLYMLRYRRPDTAGLWKGMLMKSPAAHRNNSWHAAQAIRALPYKPDMILHFHGMYIPYDPFTGPVSRFSILTDYTAALSARNWQPWSPHRSPEKRQEWLTTQAEGLKRADHIFAYSEVARRSMIDDYGIADSNVTTVGSAGDTIAPYQGEKRFGSKQLLFNGSDWNRKGGDLALDAFRLVRERIPEAKLVVIGTPPRERQAGVEFYGNIKDREELHRIFLETDIILAAAFCAPMPAFCIEGMNYGITPVVSDRDGMPEMVDYGRCGSIAQLTAGSIADEVIKLLSDPETLRAKSSAARARIAEVYNWPTIVDKMARVWDALPE